MIDQQELQKEINEATEKLRRMARGNDDLTDFSQGMLVGLLIANGLSYFEALERSKIIIGGSEFAMNYTPIYNGE